MNGIVAIDCFPESVGRYADGFAFVIIDVIRATTTAVTAVATGRRCFPARSLTDAFRIAGILANPLLAGELGGDMPEGFDMNNSPAELAARTDVDRPLVMLSSSGTRLIDAAARYGPVFLACFRNYEATADYVRRRYPKVAVIGAGSRSEFREEDQMCCGWTAELLLDAGYVPAGESTKHIVKQWRGLPPSACANGNSAAYLVRTNQAKDLAFILTSINDLQNAFAMNGPEVAMLPAMWWVARATAAAD